MSLRANRPGVAPPLAAASRGVLHAPADILALLTSTSPWSPSAGAALALAAAWSAHVTGCFVDPSLLALRGRDEEPSVLALLLEATPEAEDVADAFDELARRCGVRRATWVRTETGLARTMHRLGAWHDLIVLDQGIVQGDGSSELLGEALLGCRKPCLVLPPQWGGALAFERVALAWNGSLEATRAIHVALPFLLRAREVVVVDGAVPAAEDEAEVEPGFDPIGYLEQHDIVARRRRIHVSPHEAGDALLHEATRMEAQLLVMGAYGRSRLREKVLGGATRRILQQTTLPVLMQH